MKKWLTWIVCSLCPSHEFFCGLQLSSSYLCNLLHPGYDAIIRQHKSSDLKITALLPTPTSLLVGTSAGAVLALPLFQIPEPCPLLHPPCPAPLSLGHVDPVHFLTSIQREGTTLILSGGNGYEDFASTETSGDIPETASCLLVWELWEWANGKQWSLISTYIPTFKHWRLPSFHHGYIHYPCYVLMIHTSGRFYSFQYGINYHFQMTMCTPSCV